MKRIDRLKLVDRVARELQSTMTYADIDSYLTAFSIDIKKETTDGGGSKWVYVKDLLASEADGLVFQIADELNIDHSFALNKVVEKSESGFWKPSHFRLFLSHISSFKKKTAQLQAALLDYGITSFVAHEDIEPTKEWQDEIEKALFSMDALAAILMPEFEKSKWTDQETGVAIGRDLLVIPVRKGKDPYGFIGKYQGLQAEGKTIGEVSAELYNIIANNPRTKDAMASCVANLVLSAPDSVRAVKMLNLLKLVEGLPEKHLDRIRDNMESYETLYSSIVFIGALNEMLSERDMAEFVLTARPDSGFDDDIPF